jgi:hypothetical protein
MDNLKELALQAIVANLSEHNITRELFSGFTDKLAMSILLREDP